MYQKEIKTHSIQPEVVKEVERGLRYIYFSYSIASLKREEYRRMRIVPAHVTKHSFSCPPRVM